MVAFKEVHSISGRQLAEKLLAAFPSEMQGKVGVVVEDARVGREPLEVASITHGNFESLLKKFKETIDEFNAAAAKTLFAVAKAEGLHLLPVAEGSVYATGEEGVYGIMVVLSVFLGGEVTIGYIP